MPQIDRTTVVCLVGCVVFGLLYLRAPSRTWYFDVEGDPVSARHVCGILGLICLAVLAVKVVRWMGF